MDLIQWRPFREVSRLRNEMDRLWDEYFGAGRRAFRLEEEAWLPAVDVSETGDKITVKAEIPGMEAKDIEISMVGDTLTIKGEKKAETEEKDENYHMVERTYGSFSRAMKLPAVVDAEKVEATYKNGVLTVVLPKMEEVKPKAIEIKAE
ncbi:MAG: Hsp20/alpha crystallin family protein [Syntrophobacterales bacterium]|jgi:HSP20 family protein